MPTAASSPVLATSIPDDWRFFDNAGATFDRYSIWQGDGYLGCSESPFDPLGYGQHCQGNHPDLFGDELDAVLGREISFSDLPTDVQRAVLRDVHLIMEAETADATC